MNKIRRRFRRWLYVQRCHICNRKFMHKHRCKRIGIDAALDGVGNEIVKLHDQYKEKSNV